MKTEPVRSSTSPQLGRYDIDPERSTVTFRTRHLFGLAPVRGTFTLRAGTVDIAASGTASGINAEIEAASFSTGNGQRDRSVLSSRFLDTGRYPGLTFSSGPVEAGSQAVDGALTVCGITRPVRLALTPGVAAGTGFSARGTARIDRTEFGITAARGLAGRYLDVTVEVQCVRR
jgi:polyisoprenoid-binding protein YceI